MNRQTLQFGLEHIQDPSLDVVLAVLGHKRGQYNGSALTFQAEGGRPIHFEYFPWPSERAWVWVSLPKDAGSREMFSLDTGVTGLGAEVVPDWHGGCVYIPRRLLVPKSMAAEALAYFWKEHDLKPGLPWVRSGSSFRHLEESLPDMFDVPDDVADAHGW